MEKGYLILKFLWEICNIVWYLNWKRDQVRNISSLQDNSIVICLGETPDFPLLTLMFMFINIQRCVKSIRHFNFVVVFCLWETRKNIKSKRFETHILLYCRTTVTCVCTGIFFFFKWPKLLHFQLERVEIWNVYSW